MEIKKVYIYEETYPLLLREIKDPPDPLYYVGNLNLAHQRCIAVVGSRRTTSYGRETAGLLGKNLAECNVCVVSGMASGIDTCAHWGALNAEPAPGMKGNTIAVLGCGIDICYPASNKRLWKQIAQDGLLLSEYPGGTPPARFRFPRRNRIISGLSEATVVVQAPDSSGALITAEMAADQGRAVYSIPGNINSPYHLGSNKLIRDGAMPLVIIEDLLSDMGIKRENPEFAEKILGPEEKQIFRLLEESGEMTADQLCTASGMPAPKVMGLVTILEMKGVICTSLGKIFIAK